MQKIPARNSDLFICIIEKFQWSDWTTTGELTAETTTTNKQETTATTNNNNNNDKKAINNKLTITLTF